MTGNNSSFQADSRCSLFLYPANIETLPDMDSLCQSLQRLGLAGERFAADRLYAGERFFEHIAYLGCSPAASFEGESADDFCHIRIRRYPQITLIHSRLQARPPVCPACQKPVKDWQQAAPQSHILCPHCQTRSPVEACNWRKMAGAARLFIEITDIFPKEAIPQQSLLDALSAVHPGDWRYFYSCV